MEQETRTDFIDESGDGLLFNADGRIGPSAQGGPKHFYLGLADVGDPEGLTSALSDLRAKLPADPYFRSVPSTQPARSKTAVFFHAKDDLPEVRREVFSLLVEQDIRFLAEVKSMDKVLEYVRYRNQSDPEYRYRANELYESHDPAATQDEASQGGAVPHSVCPSKIGHRSAGSPGGHSLGATAVLRGAHSYERLGGRGRVGGAA